MIINEVYVFLVLLRYLLSVNYIYPPADVIMLLVLAWVCGSWGWPEAWHSLDIISCPQSPASSGQGTSARDRGCSQSGDWSELGEWWQVRSRIRLPETGDRIKERLHPGRLERKKIVGRYKVTKIKLPRKTLSQSFNINVKIQMWSQNQIQEAQKVQKTNQFLNTNQLTN